jgi:hypothetical protein
VSFTIKPVQRNRIIAALVATITGYLLYEAALTLKTAKSQSQSALTQAELATIDKAIQSYSAEYGTYPIVNKIGIQQPISEVYEVLNGRTGELGDKMNPRRLCYLSFSRTKDGIPLDPYGNPYHVAMDVTASGTLTLGGIVRKQRVFIWSNGPNGIDENGAGDDIGSVSEK